jgi:hypothetical protein
MSKSIVPFVLRTMAMVLGNPDATRVTEKLLCPLAAIVTKTKSFLDEAVRQGLLVLITFQDLNGSDSSRLLRVLHILWNSVMLLHPDFAPGWGLDGTTVGAERRHLTSCNR